LETLTVRSSSLHDAGKLRYDLIDVGALALLAGRLTYGAIKYPPNNWRLSRESGDWRERYYSAALRHLEAWRGGEDLDEEGVEEDLADEGTDDEGTEDDLREDATDEEREEETGVEDASEDDLADELIVTLEDLAEDCTDEATELAREEETAELDRDDERLEEFAEEEREDERLEEFLEEEREDDGVEEDLEDEATEEEGVELEREED
jgi:hypothetical protein